jgi:hypothetical protein
MIHAPVLAAFIGAVKEKSADCLKNKIGQPDNQLRVKRLTGGKSIAEYEEAVVNDHQQERDGNADAGLTAMGPNGQRNPDEREAEAGKRKRYLPMHLHPGR